MSKSSLPALHPWVVLLVIASTALPVLATDGGIKPKEYSVGVAAGPLSGAIGPAVRCWWDKWGAQVTLLPVVTVYENRENSGDFSSTDGIVFASGQLLYRLGEGLPQKPWASEPSGYVHSQTYLFGGMSTLHFLDNAWSGDVTMMGGGYGLETFWRNWRMSTGIGMAMAMIPDRTYSMDGSRHMQMDWAYFPTLEFNLSYGI